MIGALQARPVATTSSIPASTFSALLGHLPDLDETTRAELRHAGFDAGRPQLSYPTPVWRQTLEVLRRARLGDLPRDLGYRRLGAMLWMGLSQTPVGAALQTSVGDDTFRMLASVPKAISMSRTDLEATGAPESERSWSMHIHDRYPLPDLLAGMVEAALGRIHAYVSVKVHEISATEYTLAVAW